MRKTRASSGNAVAKICADIDDALNIRFVEWNAVASYIDDLEEVVKNIMALGKKRPAVALSLIRHFIQKIPGIFNSIHDECELEMFCSDVARSALTLTKKARIPLQDTGSWLLEAYLADVGDTCRFDDVPDLLVEFRWPKKERLALAGVANQFASRTHPRSALELRVLAGKLSQPGRNIRK